jgi:hypothetical protein
VNSLYLNSVREWVVGKTNGELCITLRAVPSVTKYFTLQRTYDSCQLEGKEVNHENCFGD